MVRRALMMFILLLSTSAVFSDDLAGITFLTEEYPPFNYVENGKLKGISVDILKEVFTQMGSAKTISTADVKVWSVAYNQAKYVKDICLFSTTRTEAREPLFKWVGPISQTRISVIAPKKSGIKINSVEDLKKYNIGVVRDDVAHQLLVEKGVVEKLQLTSDNKGNLDKINKGYIQLWAYESTCAFWQIKQAGLNPDDYEVVHTLKEAELYYSFNKDSNPTAIAAMSKALDELRKSGKIAEIIAKYTK